MYHPNYPSNYPQMPNQPPLGYPPVSSHGPPPQHIPNPQQLPPNHQMPFHSQPNQMPGMIPPPHSTNSQLNQSLPQHNQQIIPPNYPQIQHTDKLQQQQKAQQQLAANIKQQNQMYMRPPNLLQPSGKPASYQQQPNAYPMPPGHPNSHTMMQSPYPTHPYSMHHGPPPPHQQVDLQYHQQMNDFMRPPINNQYSNYPPPPQQNGTPFKYKYPVDNRLINQNLNTSLNSSQQSDLSQSEKIDERSETPKKQLNPPLIGSPAASMSSFHGDELENNNSSASPRTPASPAINTDNNTSLHSKNSKKGEIFAKLYDLGNEPDRKSFLDRLNAFNESQGSNNLQCPVNNKQPIDLYKLYTYVKEQGGFEGVTKKKIWKSVSSFVFGKEPSAPYTLKKHYTKYILGYECKYDLNGIDPQELLNRIDPPKDKKKSSKASMPSPSAIDSNSQNSYPQAGTPISDNSNLSTSNSNSSNKQNISTNGNQNRSATPNLSSINEKFNTQSNNNVNNLPAPTTPVSKHTQPNFDPKFNQKQQSTNSPIASHPPNYQQNLNNSFNSNYIPPGPSPIQHQFRLPNSQYALPPNADPNLITPQPPPIQSHPHADTPINNNLSHNNEFPPNHSPYHSTTEHYQNMNRTHSPQLAQRLMQQKSQIPPAGYPPNSQAPFNVPPPQNMTPNKQQTDQSNFVTPKRPPSIPPQNQMPSQMVYHPNQPPQFNSPYPNHSPYRHPFNYDENQPPPNWMNSNDTNYNKIPNLSTPMQNPQISTSSPIYSTSQMPPPQQSQLHPTAAGIPQPNKPQYLLNLLANSGSPTTPTSSSTQLPPPSLPQPSVPTPSKLIPPAPIPQQPQSTYNYGPVSQQIQSNTMHYLNNQQPQFPSDSIESVQPTFIKRKKMTAKDVNQIEAWRLMMSLKSGLLAESTWALDALSILIHDDNTYLYFGLKKLPGLLDILLEYYKHYLTEIFKDLFKDDLALDEPKSSNKNNLNDKDFEYETIKRMKKRFSDLKKEDDNLKNGNKLIDNDLINKELIKEEEKEFKQSILSPKNDYTFITRTGKEVKIKDDDNLFVSDFNKSWDIDDNQNLKTLTNCKNNLIESNRLYFSKGYGSITNYILKHFEVGESSIRFAKNLDEKYRLYEKQQEQINQNKIDNLNNNINDNNNLNDKNNLNDNKNNNNNHNNNKENLIYNDNQQKTSEYPRFRDNKRKLNNLDNYENEAYKQDQSPLCNLNDYNEAISRRCICISTLIRNISFVPGNEVELSKYKDLLFILGKLILLHHKHLEKKIKPKNENLKDLEENLFNEINNTETSDELNNLTSFNNKSKLTKDFNLDFNDSEWCWETIHFIRENTLVTLANISGKLDLSKYSECISLNIFDGLLHWSVCDSSDAQDHLPSTSLEYLTPKRLAIESLAKLSILESNVDLILSTPPWNRIEKLFKYLSDQLSRDQEQALREFALVLLHNLTVNDSSIARAIALSSDCITQLINYIEFAEQKASEIINQNGFSHFKENPEMMGTTIDMVKRAATCLLCLARNIENRPLFFNYQQRLITLSISNILHPQITSIIADILYECSINEGSFDKFKQFNSSIEQKIN